MGGARYKKMNMETYFIHISSGRGPAECCMAVSLALKELLADAASQELKTEVLHRVPGFENRTLLSATVGLSGGNAAIFCKSWNGVLLWICQSPFRRFHKRKNWFIGIQCFDKSSFPKWKETDLNFQTLRSGGPGGQHVNKVESAVRAIHVPSGLTVVVSESRSQWQNKKVAIERLKKLFDEWLLRQSLAEQQQIWQQHNALERGNPIRIYEGLAFKKLK